MGNGTKELKHLNTKIQEVASSVGITEKNNMSEKSRRQTRAPRTFPDKVTPDIDYFIDRPVV